MVFSGYKTLFASGDCDVELGDLIVATGRSRLYEGKAKIVWEIPPGGGDAAGGARAGETDALIVEFKDAATAFDGKKKGTIGGKGRCNNLVSAALFRLLEAAGVPTHFLGTLGDREMLVRRLRMIPVEVVVRNVAAGSLAKRLGLEEGVPLDRPVVELNWKRDDLGDPMVNRSHVMALGLAEEADLDRMEELALRVNDILSTVLARDCALHLVDFKLEFGRAASGAIVLGDEVSPDTCRFWDASSGEKLDKDRFRRDLGGVEEAYEEVLRRVEAAAAKWEAPSRAPATASGTVQACIYITLKKTVLDPQGSAVESALRSLGYGEVTGVRVGKFIVLELAGARPERIDEMCRRLLANPVIEDYRFEIVAQEGSGE